MSILTSNMMKWFYSRLASALCGFIALLVFLLGPPVVGLAQSAAPAWQLAVSMEGDGSPLIRSIAADSAGNVYLAGSFSKTVRFGSLTLTSRGEEDIFVAKWNRISKSFIWVQRAGGTERDVVVQLALQGTSVYVTGACQSQAYDFGHLALRNNGITGNRQAFVAKLIDEGATSHFAWVHSIGTGEAGGSALAVQGTAVFVAGSYYGTLAFPGVSLPNVSRPDLGTSDLYLLKLVDEGSGARMAWVQRAGGSMDDDPRAIALAGKNVYVAGAYNSPSSYFGPATLLNAMPSTDDAFVAKLTDAGTQGEFVWARSAGGVFHDRFYALAVKETSVYVAGFFGTTVNLGPFVARNAGNLDMVVAKLTDTGSTGEFTWVQTAGGPGYEEAQALALQGNTLYVTGEVSSPEAAFGKHVLQHDLGANVFVTKLTDLGQASAFDWVQQGGGEGNSEVNTIAVCRSQIYVGGFLPSPGHFGSLQIQNGSSVFAAFLSSLTDSLSLAATTAALTNGLEIFPNPAHAALWVRVPPLATNQPVSLTILDATGRIVRRQTQGTASQLGLAEVDLMGIATGVYLLRVQAGEIMASQRFVIQ